MRTPTKTPNVKQSDPVHERIYQAVVRRVDALTNGEYWQPKVVFLSLVICLVFAFPDYQRYVESTKLPETWRVVNHQIQSPFTQLPASELPPPESNEAKRTFRLFMPVLGHVLHLNRAGLLIVQNLMGILFLWTTLSLIYKVTRDRTSATLFVFAVSLTFPSLWFFNSFSTNLDGPGYLLLLAAMLNRNIFWVFLWLFLASFVDERVFACFGFVVIWWKCWSYKPEDWNWRKFFAIDRYVLAASAAIIVHGAIRYYLTVARGFHLPIGDAAGVGLGNIRESWKVLSPSIIAPFEGLTLFPLLAAIVAISRRKCAVLIVTTVVITALLAQSFAVGDNTRSLAYGFSLILLSAKILKELDPELDLRRMAALVASLCLLIPSFCVVGKTVSWFTPILPKLLRWIM